MNWCFALVNGRLVELFFEKKHGKPYMLGHAYVKENEYKTAHEKKQIRTETEKFRFTYRNKSYTDQTTREKVPLGKISRS